MIRLRNLSIAIAAGLAFVSTTIAVPLAPGQFISPLPGTTSAAEPQLVGAVVVEDVIRTLSGNFSTNNLPYEVRIQDRVVLATDGTYDFYYSVESVEMPPAYPLTLRRDGFTGYSANVGWRSDGIGTAAPNSVTRTVDGDRIQFNFDNGAVSEGTTTRFFFVDTQATSYAFNNEAILDLSPSFDVEARVAFSTFGPAVPEPTAIAGVSLFAVMMRRRIGCRRR